MLHRGRILVVDDEPALRELMCETLEAEGYRVLAAHNGERALELLRHCHVAAIVLDLMMPTLDGWGFIDRWRRLSADEVGIVCVSASIDGSAAQRLGTLGVRSYLAKPFELDELVGCVAQVIDDVGRPDDRPANLGESTVCCR